MPVKRETYNDELDDESVSRQIVQPDPEPEELALLGVLADLGVDLAAVAERPLQSIFIGGGTPSLL